MVGLPVEEVINIFLTSLAFLVRPPPPPEKKITNNNYSVVPAFGIIYNSPHWKLFIWSTSLRFHLKMSPPNLHVSLNVLLFQSFVLCKPPRQQFKTKQLMSSLPEFGTHVVVYDYIRAGVDKINDKERVAGYVENVRVPTVDVELRK